MAYYNGRATDIHGNRIGTDYHDGDFPFDALDANDLPRFESQAAYLKRYGLFMPGEERRLPANAYDAEVLTND